MGKVADGLNGGISHVAHASSEALAHGASCCTYKPVAVCSNSMSFPPACCNRGSVG